MTATIDGTSGFTGPATKVVVGTTTNDSAAAGYVGEFQTANAANTTVSLTNGAAANLISISLTAGDWDVDGAADYVGNAATVVYASVNSISTTSATQGSLKNTFYAGISTYFGSVSGTGYSSYTPKTRISLNATTTVYLVGTATFTTNTMTGGGTINARRVR